MPSSALGRVKEGNMCHRGLMRVERRSNKKSGLCRLFCRWDEQRGEVKNRGDKQRGGNTQNGLYF